MGWNFDDSSPSVTRLESPAYRRGRQPHLALGHCRPGSRIHQCLRLWSRRCVHPLACRARVSVFLLIVLTAFVQLSAADREASAPMAVMEGPWPQPAPPKDLRVEVEKLTAACDSEAARRLSDLLRQRPSAWLARSSAACLAEHRRYEAVPLLLRYALLGHEQCTAALEEMGLPEAAIALVLNRIINGRVLADAPTRERLKRLMRADAGEPLLAWDDLYYRVAHNLPSPLPKPIRDEAQRVVDLIAFGMNADVAYLRLKNREHLPKPRSRDYDAVSTDDLSIAMDNFAREVETISRVAITTDGFHSVDFRGAKIHGHELEFLAEFDKLVTIDLTDTGIDDAKLALLPPLDRVEQLVLTGTAVTDAGLTALKGVQDLKHVYLGRTRVTAVGLGWLVDRARLIDLGLESTAMGDEAIDCLQGEDRLFSLLLDGTRVTDAGVARLAESRTLQWLSLDDTSIGDLSLASLAKVPQLTQLWLDGTQITAQGLASLENLKLQFLGLNRTALGDEAVPALVKLRGLDRLDLQQTRLTDAGLAGLLALPALNTLTLNGTQVSGAGFCRAAERGHLARSALKELAISDTRLNDDAMACVARIPRLENLWARNTQITAKGLRPLAACPLKKLDLAGATVGDDALEVLAPMKSLRILNLDETRISDAGIPALKAMGHLESTSLRGTKLSSRALEELRLALPHVRIRGDIAPPAQPPDRPALAPLFQQGA